MQRTSSQSVRPDIIDVFIIILLAAALDIFIFWMATQFTRNPVFQVLPGFVTGTFSGVWSSVAAGTAGIGLVVVKYISAARTERPNYFLYIVGTAAGLFILILLLALISIYLNGSDENSKTPRPPPPAGAFRLDIPSDGSAQIFIQENGNQWFSFSYQGTIALKDGMLRGTLNPSTFSTSEKFQPLPSQTLNALAVKFCRWAWIGGTWSVDWSPAHNGVNNSVPFDVALKTKLTVTTPELAFEVPVPQDADLSQSWLCMRLDFNGGGFFPFP